MRIITGKARGLKLLEPKNYDVRPTADRVKESLFNILGTGLREARILDLFAGTGNLGLEAWSRGAASITFVDMSLSSLKLVRGNIAKCRAEEACTVLKGDALQMLGRLAHGGQQFDYLFCDPPYNKGWVQKVLNSPNLVQVLSLRGLLIAEHSAHDDIDLNLPVTLKVVRRERYGETILSLIMKIL
jgi:16S rRNA (guanine966-N2)-methyltransferase